MGSTKVACHGVGVINGYHLRLGRTFIEIIISLRRCHISIGLPGERHLESGSKRRSEVGGCGLTLIDDAILIIIPSTHHEHILPGGLHTHLVLVGCKGVRPEIEARSDFYQIFIGIKVVPKAYV